MVGEAAPLLDCEEAAVGDGVSEAGALGVVTGLKESLAEDVALEVGVSSEDSVG